MKLKDFSKVVGERSLEHYFAPWMGDPTDLKFMSIWYRRIRWAYADGVITAEEAIMLILELQKHGYENLDKYPDFVAEVFDVYKAGGKSERKGTSNISENCGEIPY